MKIFLFKILRVFLLGLLLASCSEGGVSDTQNQPSAPVPNSSPTTGTVDQTLAQAEGTQTSEPHQTTGVEFCTSPAELTPADAEGPYWKADSPERRSLLDKDMPGTKLIISGYVFSPDCQPVSNALLDFWQADAEGIYDNNGYTLRGHQFTDENGYYELETIVPGQYPGRPEHIHVKIQAPSNLQLTTQLYFPEISSNQDVSFLNQNLILSVEESNGQLFAIFNFVIGER